MELAYGERIQKIERMLQDMAQSNDIQVAMRLYEETMKHIQTCEAQLKEVEGSISKVIPD